MNPLLLSSCVTYWFLSEEEEKRGDCLSTIVTAEDLAAGGGGGPVQMLCVACLSGENVFVRGRQFTGERVGKREAAIELRVRGRVSRQLD